MPSICVPRDRRLRGAPQAGAPRFPVSAPIHSPRPRAKHPPRATLREGAEGPGRPRRRVSTLRPPSALPHAGGRSGPPPTGPSRARPARPASPLVASAQPRWANKRRTPSIPPKGCSDNARRARASNAQSGRAGTPTAGAAPPSLFLGSKSAKLSNPTHTSEGGPTPLGTAPAPAPRPQIGREGRRGGPGAAEATRRKEGQRTPQPRLNRPRPVPQKRPRPGKCLGARTACDPKRAGAASGGRTWRTRSNPQAPKLQARA